MVVEVNVSVNQIQKPVGGVGIAWLKTPIENCVDGSADCVSVYAPAVGLIDKIRKMYMPDVAEDGE